VQAVGCKPHLVRFLGIGSADRHLYLSQRTASEAAPRKGRQKMKIVPASIEEQINRVDRQRSLYFGIGASLVTVWSVVRLFWLLYIGLTFGWFWGSMIFQFVLWGVIGAVAAVAATGFLTRYKSGS
jgi:hypothetical protein